MSGSTYDFTPTLRILLSAQREVRTMRQENYMKEKHQ